MNLCDDNWIEILSFLSTKDISKIRLINSYFNYIVDIDYIWRYRLFNDFGFVSDNPYNMYKFFHVSSKRRNKEITNYIYKKDYKKCIDATLYGYFNINYRDENGLSILDKLLIENRIDDSYIKFVRYIYDKFKSKRLLNLLFIIDNDDGYNHHHYHNNNKIKF